MYPLIEITSVPIEIRMKTTSASLEYTRGTAEMEISRSDKGIDIKSRPIQLKLDTFEQRRASEHRAAAPATAAVTPQGVNSTPAGTPTAPAEREAAYEATSAYSEQGQIMLNARFGQQGQMTQADRGTIPDAVRESLNQESEPLLSPETLEEFKLEDGQMEIRYEMDKLNFDWKIDRGSFEFTPGDIEITVEQRPKVIIKYVGGPIYVPRSADPNYEPADQVDVKA